MATYTSTGRSAHRSVTASTELIITLDKPYRFLELSWDPAATATLYATIATGYSDGSNPTVVAAADGTYHVEPGGTRTIRDDYLTTAGSPSKIHVISTSAGTVHVTGHDKVPGGYSE